jgi:hypothetical protein
MITEDGSWRIVSLAAELEGVKGVDRFGAPRYIDMTWEEEEGDEELEQKKEAMRKAHGMPEKNDVEAQAKKKAMNEVFSRDLKASKGE